ncbi:hypothetical protein VTN77DRAFT_6004 [Rasamsonia byssochlamydoides]|uniref:uncharacterized protein n=1 Tax=Rasamsonia byssochlamydoides TaxID=89139 RepID=UPI00374406FC
MPYHDAPIRPLPADVAAKIKSSISITHLNGVVLELVKNSLDADAVSINITLDYRRGGCIVEDDGHGIPPAEFKDDSRLGQAHCTSKFGLGEGVYGYKGLFLASLAAMSLLTITSRHSQQANANTVIFHHGKTISRLIPSPPQQSLDHNSHGTKVTVNDLFGNMPVRVKSRALALQRPDDMDREWDELKRMLTALVLANEQPLKLVLSEIDKNRKVVIRAKSPSVERSESSRTGVDLTRIGSILTQAGFIPLKSTESWVTVSARTPDLSIYSSISLFPSPTKQVQFISMGINPIFAHNSANVLYNEVNRIFAASDFGTTGSYQEAEEQRKTTVLQTGTNIKGSSKGINRWPMFYIRIEMGESWRVVNEEADTLESNRSFQRILDVLGEMVYQFLEQHHFRPRARKRLRQSPGLSSEPDRRHGQTSRKQGDVARRISASAQPQNPMNSTEETLDNRIELPSFQKRPSALPTQDFGSWWRIKSGNGNIFDEICSGIRRPEPAQGTSLPPRSSQKYPGANSQCLVQRDLRGRRGKVDNGGTVEGITTQSTGSDSGDGIISWIDPLTKSTVLINSRTGQCLPQRPLSSTVTSTSLLRPRSTGSLGDRRNLDVIKRPQSAPSRKNSLWLEDIMDQWDNPAFPRLEKPISSIRSGVNGEGCTEGKLGFRIRPDSSSLLTCGDASVAKSSGKLWKRGLAEADVIAQVDRKFILVRMTAAPLGSGNHNSGSLLVLVDQHAADERCRIEQLFDEMFTSQAVHDSSGEVMNVRTLELSSPISFEIAAHETRLFKVYSEFFASWGCHYEVSDVPEEGHATVSVKALPTLIAERCRAEPKLVVDLLRGEIWKREENNRDFSVRPALATSKKLPEDILPSWVEQIADCPEGIIDLLNSRACRTAVMFNDVLSIEECENLISRLSRCVFPFQCAHGRPSMIPMLDLTSQMQEDDLGMLDIGYERTKNDLGTESELGFPEAFRAWKDTQGL